jgi:GNAT superfamily N-acetyltransferase
VSPHLVVPARAADAGTLSQIIAEAFHGLPPARWLVRDPVTRAAIFPGYFQIFVELTLASGVVHTTRGRDGVALWLPVSRAGPGEPGAGYQARLAEVTGPFLDRFEAFDAALDRGHPAGFAHHYLAILAVRPAAQGQGIGTALLRAHHATLDATGVPAVLEASAPRNHALYRRHGYVDKGRPILLPDGPVLWPMVRAVRSRSAPE